MFFIILYLVFISLFSPLIFASPESFSESHLNLVSTATAQSLLKQKVGKGSVCVLSYYILQDDEK